jgi:hypothetical protein
MPASFAQQADIAEPRSLGHDAVNLSAVHNHAVRKQLNDACGARGRNSSSGRTEQCDFNSLAACHYRRRYRKMRPEEAAVDDEEPC